MKEFYIAPEAEIVCFAPAEDIAWENVPDVMLFNSGSNGGVSIDIPLDTNPDDGDSDFEDD